MVFEVGESGSVLLVHSEEGWNGSHEEDGVEEALKRRRN